MRAQQAPTTASPPIDIVILWVNDADPQWQQSLKQYRSKAPPSHQNETISGAQRFRDFNTLKYALRSIERYAPWYQRVFLVTCGHLPEWLNTAHPRLIHKTHAEFFKNPAHLPTFNSNAIQMNLHYIHELAEQFILFDDDLILTAPLRPEDFFKKSLPVKSSYWGLSVEETTYTHHCNYNMALVKSTLRHSVFSTQYWQGFLSVLTPLAWAYNLAAFLSKQSYYPKKSLLPAGTDHVPMPMLKSYNAYIEQLFAPHMQQTSAHRFRTATDASPFFLNLVYYARGHFRLGTLKDRIIRLDDHMQSLTQLQHYKKSQYLSKLQYALITLLTHHRQKILCLHDETTNALSPQAAQNIQTAVTKYLEDLLPDKSSFER